MIRSLSTTVKFGVLLVLVVAGALLWYATFGPGTAAGATTFTVDSTADDVDANPGDGVCDTVVGLPVVCTLRAAIQESNNFAGTDTIEFNIAGAGPHTISPGSALPPIIEPVTIDGYTQPGASANTNGPGLATNAVMMIELEGSNAGSGANGLTITAGSSTVRGLVINRFTHNGILLDGAGASFIEGNYIGTDTAGTAALGNTDGVGIKSADNTIGGTSAEKRNVISGNTTYGVIIRFGFNGNVVQGNYIGTDASGTAALGNLNTGIDMRGDMNTIGGTTPGARNVISGNGVSGIAIPQVEARENVIQGNYIGTDAGGTAALGNFLGVKVGGPFNVIGGTVPGAGNLISGNDEGVRIGGFFAVNNTILGNYIGTQADGTSPLGNSDHGVLLNSWRTTLGGAAIGAANTIAYNGGDGVHLCRVCTAGAKRNLISQNSIYANTGLGIDLADDGVVTANDLGDGDSGTNNLQNFPVLTSAESGSTNIEGTLNSRANTEFTIEFFSNSSCDGSGNGEGETYLGSTTETTDGSGDVSFSVSFTATVALGDFITATATDPSDNTSEFSECVEVTLPVKLAKPGDTDGDGCPDAHENGLDETQGGLRDWLDPNDYYDVLGPGGSLTLDGVIDLTNDIFGVIQHYAPTGTEPEYDVNFDRGPSAGPNVWNMTAPDGVIDLTNDILGVILQYQHNCQ